MCGGERFRLGIDPEPSYERIRAVPGADFRQALLHCERLAVRPGRRSAYQRASAAADSSCGNSARSSSPIPRRLASHKAQVWLAQAPPGVRRNHAGEATALRPTDESQSGRCQGHNRCHGAMLQRPAAIDHQAPPSTTPDRPLRRRPEHVSTVVAVPPQASARRRRAPPPQCSLQQRSDPGINHAFRARWLRRTERSPAGPGPCLRRRAPFRRRSWV